MSINLKDTTYLLNNGFIMRTKGGNLWRCGRGYRKDWTKLIGKKVLLHNKPYILTNRVKKNNKWYLVFTDGQNNYTERQDKALHNKKLAKDTIIEAAKRVIAGLLPAPMELIDKLVQETQCIIRDFRQSYYTEHGKYPIIAQEPITNEIYPKISFIFLLAHINDDLYKQYKQQLMHYYHPDMGNTSDTTYIHYIKLASDSVERMKKLNWKVI